MGVERNGRLRWVGAERFESLMESVEDLGPDKHETDEALGMPSYCVFLASDTLLCNKLLTTCKYGELLCVMQVRMLWCKQGIDARTDRQRQRA